MRYIVSTFNTKASLRLVEIIINKKKSGTIAQEQKGHLFIQK